MNKKEIQKQKKGLKITKFISLIIVIILVLLLPTTHMGQKNTTKPSPIIKQNIVDKLSLIMVGDALIHDEIYLDAKENNTYNFDKMFTYIKNVVSNYDLAYYNQETILGGTSLGLSSYPAFNSPQEFGDSMIDAGFNLVSLATNHTLDRQEQAVINSRNYWNSKEDVLAVGSYNSFEERNAPQIRTKNNITYTMLNYTYGTNGIKVPNGKEYLVNIWPVTGTNPDTDQAYQNYKQTVSNDIALVKDKTDILIVAMHWGTEYELTPNNYQKDMALFLAQEGVDIIIGTHPHVIQPIEWINNTLVIYSLGNFISAHEVLNMDNRIGLMTSIDITKTTNPNTKETTIDLDNLNNELIYTYYNNYKNFQVIPFTNLTDDYLKDYKEISKKYINIIRSIDNKIPINTFN